MRNSLSEAAGKGGARRIEAFVYRDSGQAPASLEPGYCAEPELPLEVVSEAEAQAREAQARREATQAARQEAEQRGAAELERRLQVERDGLAGALREFGLQRQDYFLQLEREVVQLALGIARKLLQREAQIDPLLLAGTVRVALDQLAGAAAVELYVPPSTLGRWEELLRQETEPGRRPQLRADPALEPAGCRVQTDTGTTDLSLESQLREVEQGFMELLDRRTRAVAGGAGAAGTAANA